MVVSLDRSTLTRDDIALARRIYGEVCDRLALAEANWLGREAVALRVIHDMIAGERDPGVLRDQAVRKDF